MRYRSLTRRVGAHRDLGQMSELENQIKNRREKIRRLRASGVEPFPRGYDLDLEPAMMRLNIDYSSAGCWCDAGSSPSMRCPA